MIIDIFRNPVIIGVLAGVLTYMYVWWCNESKFRNNPNEKKRVGVLMPAVVAIVVWALTYAYMELTCDLVIDGDNDNNNINNEGRHYGFAKDVPSINETVDFKMIEKGLTVPNNLVLPDVFIETM